MRLSRPARKQSGFSLVELLTVAAIIGILLAIALPNYNEYVRRSRAAEGTTTLSNARVQMEQFFQDNRTYDCNAVGGCQPANQCPTGVQMVNTANFTYTCTLVTATTYKLNAIGAGNMINFNFTIDQANNRSSIFDGTNGNSCWLTAKGGSC